MYVQINTTASEALANPYSLTCATDPYRVGSLPKLSIRAVPREALRCLFNSQSTRLLEVVLNRGPSALDMLGAREPRKR